LAKFASPSNWKKRVVEAVKREDEREKKDTKETNKEGKREPPGNRILSLRGESLPHPKTKKKKKPTTQLEGSERRVEARGRDLRKQLFSGYFLTGTSFGGIIVSPASFSW